MTSSLIRATDDATGLALPDGWHASIMVRDLRQPTHAAFAPDGRLYITQLNGGENDAAGQVLRLNADGTTTVVISRLLKPTGLAWADGALYIVSREYVLMSRPDVLGAFSAPQQVTEALPFNGRSNGQIAIGPDGLLYFQSTGNENIPDSSGLIYAAKPEEPSLQLERVARGLKNAYSFAWNPDNGRMYATEIGDGAIAGVGQPPEELNVVRRGGNYGWPRCYDNQKENAAFGGERTYCADTDVPLATFPPQSTPTGLAFYDGNLIVALWGLQKLVSVDPNSGGVSDLVLGFQRPVALVVTPDRAALLVIDIDAGVIYSLNRS
ncbi:MAG: PQQ-dependent sugar dehydrogenase [Anaerolineae bacterium]